MRDGQIERLLGGYATNTLTESERQALFEAALDDQELFDALNDEQALRELLEDPSARPMIERAANATRPEPVRGWLSRPLYAHAWAWGLAGCAAAAGVLVFLLGPFGQATRPSGEIAVLKAPATAPIETAVPSAPAPAPPPIPAAKYPDAPSNRGRMAKSSAGMERHEGRVAQSYGSVPAVAVAPPAAIQAPAQNTALGGGDQAQVQMDKLNRSLPGAGFRAGIATAAMSGAIPYAVVRRAPDGSFAPLPAGEELQAGDSVRLAVRPPVSGSLTLYERSAEGNWNSIQALQVSAGGEYPLPSSPIQVNGETRLRLVMIAGEGAGPSDLREASKDALSRPKQRLSNNESARVAPITAAQVSPRTLTAEITLVPGKPLGR